MRRFVHTVITALHKLEEDAFAVSEPGSRNSSSYRSLRPYREAAEQAD
jgi:hypothetical protein